MAADYVKQIRELRNNLNNRRMSPKEVYDALIALERAFPDSAHGEEFYSEYLSLQEECEDSMDRGLLEEVLIGE